MLAASRGQVVSIGQSASRALLALESASRSRELRRGRAMMASQPNTAQHTIASPGPQATKQRQEKLVKDELPACDSPQSAGCQRDESPHELGPCSEANDMRR